MVKIQLGGILLNYLNGKYIKICGVRFWITIVSFIIKYTSNNLKLQCTILWWSTLWSAINADYELVLYHFCYDGFINIDLFVI